MYEIFKPIDFIPNCNGYEITNKGRLWSNKTNSFLKQFKSKKGYMNVYLYINSNNDSKHKVKRFQVHRLVAQAFIPNPNNLPQVNHKDENKENNNTNNLEWCSNSYNHNYGTRNYRQSQSIKGKPRLDKRKSVVMCDIKYHKPIKTFNSISEAELELKGKICSSNIGKVCKNQLSQALGYWWCYEDELYLRG